MIALTCFIAGATCFSVGYFVGIVRQSEKDLERHIRERELAERHYRNLRPPQE